MEHIIEVENIKCGGCATTIRNRVASLADVTNVAVDVEGGKVAFERNSNEIQDIIDTLKKSGYPLKGEGNMVDGAKSFVSCMVGKIDNKINN